LKEWWIDRQVKQEIVIWFIRSH